MSRNEEKPNLRTFLEFLSSRIETLGYGAQRILIDSSVQSTVKPSAECALAACRWSDEQNNLFRSGYRSEYVSVGNAYGL